MLSHALRKLSLVGGWADAHRTAHLRAGRYVWSITPSGEKLFGPGGPDLDGWIRDGLATLTKQGPQRTVYRVCLPGGAVFAKRCRINGLRAWFRELLRPAKARLEFENAVMLRDLGLPVVEPLAWAKLAGRGPGESIFVTRCQDGAGSLQGYLDDAFPNVPRHLVPKLRHETARELGILLARLHDAGVAHPDPHPGNLLATQRSGAAPAITIIDLHAIGFGHALSWRDSLNNLVLFNRWFQVRASRTDRLRFWHAYVTHRTTLTPEGPLTLDRMAKLIESRTEGSNARFWMNRFRRYRKSSRHVHYLDGPVVSGYSVRDLPPKFAERLAADPDAPFRDGSAKLLKDSPSSTVIELTVPTPDGPRAAIYKRFRIKSPLIVLKSLLRPTAAMRSWMYGHNLLDRGLPTARPLCVLQRRRGIFFAEGYFLAEKIENSIPLHDAAAAACWRTIRVAALNVGQLLRNLHEKRVRHRDLKASNILISSDLVPSFIDLVGMMPSSRRLPKAIRIRDVSRLAASFLHSRNVTRSDKLRVLRAYLAWGLHGRGDWKSWWRAIDAAIQRKRAKNARRGRPLA